MGNSTLHYTCTAKECLGEIEHVHKIWVTSHFAYVELRLTRSIFSFPLDFEIARLTCTNQSDNFLVQNNRDQARGRLGRNSRPRGRNFALNGTQGEVGVSLKKNKKKIFFFFFFF